MPPPSSARSTTAPRASCRSPRPSAQVAEAIRAVLDGAALGARHRRRPRRRRRRHGRARRQPHPQQLRVLLGMAEGKLNKQIAFDMAISEQTVKDHVTVILRKLGASQPHPGHPRRQPARPEAAPAAGVGSRSGRHHNRRFRQALRLPLERLPAVRASAKGEYVAPVVQLDCRFERYLAQARRADRDLPNSPLVLLPATFRDRPRIRRRTLAAEEILLPLVTMRDDRVLADAEPHQRTSARCADRGSRGSVDRHLEFP